MATEKELFPVTFVLERVKNGFVLTSKQEATSMLNAPKYEKEVVISENIYTRVGKLLNIDSLIPEHPVVYYVDSITQKSYENSLTSTVDPGIQVKLRYCQFFRVSKRIPKDTLILLNIKETKTLEMYGQDAETAAKSGNIQVKRSGSISYLILPSDSEGRKAFSRYYNKISIVDASLGEIMEWDSSHKVPDDLEVNTPVGQNSK